MNLKKAKYLICENHLIDDKWEFKPKTSKPLPNYFPPDHSCLFPHTPEIKICFFVRRMFFAVLSQVN